MIIQSLLDTDLYKFTMMQAVWSRFPSISAEYAFQCRSSGIDLRPFAKEIRDEVNSLATLAIRDSELDFLRSIRYMKPGFVDSLKEFGLDPSAVEITTEPEFALRIRGSWLQTILFEVPVLAIVNEVYFRHAHPASQAVLAEGRRRLCKKCDLIAESPTPLRIMEFGTRRRYSGAWQREVVETLQSRIGEKLVGTSNVSLAHALRLKPFGTMAHEFLQAGQALAHPLDSQRFMLEHWMQEYRGDLGIALSDIFGFDAFLGDFDRLFSKAYDGCRHDSGDPMLWGEKLVAHYEGFGIDPKAKTAVFSDGLDIPKALALAERFEGRIRTMFGIGTNFTNDLGFSALQIVLKMVRCNGRPVVKLSDSPGKAMSEDAAYVDWLRKALQASAPRATLPTDRSQPL